MTVIAGSRSGRPSTRTGPATTGEVVGAFGRALGALLLRLARLLWVRPATTAVAALVVLVVAVGDLWGVLAVALAGVGLLVVRHCRPEVWDQVARPWAWERGRVRRERARREGRRLAVRLELVDRAGRPYRCVALHDGPTGELTGLDLVAPLSDAEIERRLGVWAAILEIPPGAALVLRHGDRHAGHRIVEVVVPPPPLPDRVELPVGGDFTAGLILGVREDGELWRWAPRRDGPHLLVTGATNGGKSALVARIVQCFLAAGGEVAALDYAKGTAFGDLVGVPGVRRAVTKGECEALLADARSEMMRRYETLQADPDAEHELVPLLVVIEEIFVLVEATPGRDEAAREDQHLSELIGGHLAAIAHVGRAARVHAVACSQRGDARVLGGGASRDQFSRIVLTRNASDATLELGAELARSTLIPGREPPAAVRDLPAPPGRALVRTPDGFFVAQVSL